MAAHIFLMLLFFLLTFVISLFLVGGLYYFDIMSVKKANEAVLAKQASHKRLTSRFGGLAALAALLIGSFLTPDKLIFLIMLSSIPVLVAGGIEDMGYNLKPVHRLNAALASGFIAIYLTGLWLDNVDLTILGPILSLPFIAICFTAFASAGISHSINVVDGINGLASGIIILIGLALCIISFSVGEVGLGTFCIILVGSMLGFFIWNFPKGLVFLGDSGAYTYGHLLVWIAISLFVKHPEISAWAIFCIFFWPIMDTLGAILRRSVKRISINKADYMHFHQLVMRFIVLSSGGRPSNKLANPLTTVLILPFCILLAFLGVSFLEDNFLSIITVMFSTTLFFGSYYLLIWLVRSNSFRKFKKK